MAASTTLELLSAELARSRLQLEAARNAWTTTLLAVRDAQVKRLSSSPLGMPEVVWRIRCFLPGRRTMPIVATCYSIEVNSRILSPYASNQRHSLPHLVLRKKLLAIPNTREIEFHGAISCTLVPTSSTDDVSTQTRRCNSLLRSLSNDGGALEALHLHLPDNIELDADVVVGIMKMPALVNLTFRGKLSDDAARTVAETLRPMPKLQHVALLGQNNQQTIMAQVSAALLERCPSLQSFTGSLGPLQYSFKPAARFLQSIEVDLPQPCWFQGMCCLLNQCDALKSLKTFVTFRTFHHAEHIDLHGQSSLDNLTLHVAATGAEQGEQVAKVLNACKHLRCLSLDLLVDDLSAASFSTHVQDLANLEQFEIKGPRRGSHVAQAAGCKEMVCALLRSASKRLQCARIGWQGLDADVMLSVLQQQPLIEEITYEFSELRLQLNATAPTDPQVFALKKLKADLSEPLTDGSALRELIVRSPRLQIVRVRLDENAATTVLGDLPQMPSLQSVTFHTPMAEKHLPSLMKNLPHVHSLRVRKHSPEFAFLEAGRIVGQEDEERTPPSLSADIDQTTCMKTIVNAMACVPLKKVSLNVLSSSGFEFEDVKIPYMQHIEVLELTWHHWGDEESNEGVRDQLVRFGFALLAQCPAVSNADMPHPTSLSPILELVDANPRIKEICCQWNSLKIIADPVSSSEIGPHVLTKLRIGRPVSVRISEVQQLCDVLIRSQRLEDLHLEIGPDIVTSFASQVPELPQLQRLKIRGSPRNGDLPESVSSMLFLLGPILRRMPKACKAVVEDDDLDITSEGEDQSTVVLQHLEICSWRQACSQVFQDVCDCLLLSKSLRTLSLCLQVPVGFSDVAIPFALPNLHTLGVQCPMHCGNGDAERSDDILEFALTLIHSSPYLEKASIPMPTMGLCTLLDRIQHYPSVDFLEEVSGCVELQFAHFDSLPKGELASGKTNLKKCHVSNVDLTFEEFVQLVNCCPLMENMKLTVVPSDSNGSIDSVLLPTCARLLRVDLTVGGSNEKAWRLLDRITTALTTLTKSPSSLTELKLQVSATGSEGGKSIANLLRTYPLLEVLALHVELDECAADVIACGLPCFNALHTCTVRAGRPKRHGGHAAAGIVAFWMPLASVATELLHKAPNLHNMTADFIHVDRLPPRLGIEKMTIGMRSSTWMADIVATLQHCSCLKELTVHGEVKEGLSYAGCYLSMDAQDIDTLCRSVNSIAPEATELQTLRLSVDCTDCECKSIHGMFTQVFGNVQVLIQQRPRNRLRRRRN